MPHSPPTLRGAAVVEAAEAAMVLAATVLSGVDTATGRSYQLGSGIALTLIGFCCAVALAAVAAGVASARGWSRTPALLTQLFVGIVGIYLLEGHRLDWGVPSVALAVAGFVTLLSPPSLRALAGKAEQEAPGQAGPQQAQVRQEKANRAQASGGKPGGKRKPRAG